MKLHRTIPLERIRDILATGHDRLVHPREWPDPFETTFLYENVLAPTYRYDGKVSSEPPPPGVAYKRGSWFMENPAHGHAHFIFCQCWSTRLESDAIWRTTHRHVRVTIDADILHARIEAAARGRRFEFIPATYRAVDDILARRKEFLARWTPALGKKPPGDWFEEIVPLLAEKRDGYEAEHELRVVLYDNVGHDSWLRSNKEIVPLAERSGMPSFYPYQTNFNADIESVLLHPSLTGSEVAEHRAELNAYGVTRPISQSTFLQPVALNVWR